MLKLLKNWFRGTNKLERFWLLSKIEFKLRYYENRFGLIWALIKPLSEMLIYYIAFEFIMKNRIPNYVSFLFIALILWNFFVESSTGTIQILSTKKYLYEYTNMNKIEIYFSVIGSNLIGLFFNLSIFIIYILTIANGIYISWHWVFLLPIIFNLIILSLGFSLILSNIYIIAKDINQVWSIIISMSFWLSPILYKLEKFREALPGLDFINPVAGIIINSRKVTLYNSMPEWDLFGWDFLYSLFFLFIGIYLLNSLGSKSSEKL